MTVVNIKVKHRLPAAARGTKAGVLLWAPTRRVNEGDTVLPPEPFTVALVDGEATVDVEATGPAWAWRVTERFGPGSTVRTVAVPAAGPVDYTALVDVDPATLAPDAEPEAAWWAVADSTVTAGAIEGDDLILARNDGTTVNAGNVRGPAGSDATVTAEAVEAALPSSFPSSRIAIAELAASPAAVPQVTPTYDGSGQAVHPDIFYKANGWNGFKYWMAMTPYPGGVADFENPSILASNDGASWVVPPGMVNPIAAPPAGFWPDPDLTFDPDTGRLYCVWAGTRVSWSDTGSTWSPPLVLVATAGEVSPAVIREKAGDYRMWSVQKIDGAQNKILHRRAGSLESSDGWAATTDCTFVPPYGKEVWHFEAVKISDQYLAAVTCCDYDTAGANTTMFLATSEDGMAWTFAPAPLLTGRAGAWDETNIYRASLLPATGSGGTVADLWYSARSAAGAWRIGRTQLKWKDPAIAGLSPLGTIAKHTDTLEAKGSARNVLSNPTLLLASGIVPAGTANNLVGATGHRWDEATESYEFSLGSATAFNLSYPGHAVAPGEVWTFSFEGTTNIDGKKIDARIIWFTAGGAVISTSFAPKAIFPKAGTFERIQVTGTAPVTAATATCVFVTAGGDATVVKYNWRRAQFERAQAATPWTPGSAVRAVAAAGQTRPLAEWMGPITNTGQAFRGGVTKDGAILLANYTTATRPAAATAGKGAVIYDSTLNLPVFSDGAVWKNFAGATV